MIDRLTNKARLAVIDAKMESDDQGVSWCGTEHLLLGVTRIEGIAASAITTLYGSSQSLVEDMRQRVISAVGSESGISGRTADLSNVMLKLAPAEAKSFGDNFVGTEHLLLAMMRLDEGAAVRILRSMDLDVVLLEQEVIKLMPGSSEGSFDRNQRTR